MRNRWVPAYKKLNDLNIMNTPEEFQQANEEEKAFVEAYDIVHLRKN